MPRYLALYTADAPGAGSPEHVQKMSALMDRQFKAGKLLDTGGLKKRESFGLRVRRKNAVVTVEEGAGAWAAASGWAMLQANSREDLIADVKEFLAAAGDGVSEIIEIADGPPPNA